MERVGQDEITPLFSLKEGNTRKVGDRYARAQTAAWALDRKTRVNILPRTAPQLGPGCACGLPRGGHMEEVSPATL